jgi:hypothetical protein
VLARNLTLGAAAVLFILSPGEALADVAGSPRLGVYYFEGWAGGVNSPHIRGIRSAAIREPIWGWSDRGDMARQLRYAARAGVGFFAFHWYWAPRRTRYPYLNRGLAAYRALPPRRRAGVEFAVSYVNAPPISCRGRNEPGFVVPRTQWRGQVGRWSRHFRSPGYARVGGRALFIILDAAQFIAQWGGVAGANRAIAALHRAGAYVAAGAVGDTGLEALRVDALTQFHYPTAAGAEAGRRRWSALAGAAHRLWRDLSGGPKPLIPSSAAGWDPRPWSSSAPCSPAHRIWYPRTPGRVAALLHDAVDMARRERIPGRPLVLMPSWNEYGEGHYIAPTHCDGFRYGRAVASVIGD